jgi:hypothetical protein
VTRSADPVRGATARMRFLISAHAASIGLKSYEYGGKNRRVAPACSISSRTGPALWAAKVVHHRHVAATQVPHEATTTQALKRFAGDPRRNSSRLIFAPTPATILGCWSC